MSSPLLYLNTTEVDDPFFDTSSFSDNLEFYSTFIWVSIIANIISIYVVGLTVFCAQIFYISLFCKYPEFRTRTNVFVLWGFILGVLIYVQQICTKFGSVSGLVPLEALCFIIEFDQMANIFYFIFPLSLAFDTVISSRRNVIIRFYNLTYKYLLVGIYLAFLIILTLKWTYCFFNPIAWLYGRLHETNAICYTVVVILILVLNIVAKRLSKDSVNFHGLMISNIAAFAYFPAYVHHVLIVYFKLHYFLKEILMLSQFVPEIIARGHPLLILYLIIKHNDVVKQSKFVVFFTKMLKRNREVNQGQVDILEKTEDSTDEVGEISANQIDDIHALLL